EQLILRQNLKGDFNEVNRVASLEQVLRDQSTVREVYMDERIEQYIIDIVFATRTPSEYRLNELEPVLDFGVSQRSSIVMATAAKCYAYIIRRCYVIPEDVRAVAMDVLRHRVGITYEAEAESITSEEIIEKIISVIEVPQYSKLKAK